MSMGQIVGQWDPRDIKWGWGWKMYWAKEKCPFTNQSMTQTTRHLSYSLKCPFKTSMKLVIQLHLIHEKRLQTMLWHNNARVNSHQRWKQTRFRVCFHLWCELTSTMNVTEWYVSWNSCFFSFTFKGYECAMCALRKKNWFLFIERALCVCHEFLQVSHEK